MWAYIICAGIWAGIIAGWLIPVIRKRLFCEVYAACGIGILFSLIVLVAMVWQEGDILPLRYIGWALYVPAAALVISSFVSLKHKGKPESGWEHSTVLIHSGVFRIIRHPLFLGSALFTIGLILIAQSIPATILGLVGVSCLWMASKGEEELNIKKFGQEYQKYMQEVPRWNLFKGLKLTARKRGPTKGTKEEKE